MTAAAISETIKGRMFHFSFHGGQQLFANSIMLGRRLVVSAEIAVL
jgi:hypothetical protein